MNKKALVKLHARFNSILPRIECHARVIFRNIKCWQTKEDKVQEVRGFTWKWVYQLHQLKRKWWKFVSRLADFAARAVRSGRKIAGMTVRDVMSEIAQTRHGFYVGKLPDFSTESTNPLVEALTDNTVSEIPEQVIFRIDFPEFRGSYGERDQAVMDDMMVGERTKELAEKHKMSQGRISQLRRQFYEGWGHFHGDEVTNA